ncbi:hypothetical protein RCO28_09770 [Streptomyces sp. LHD-70]|uniref:hypothetical protein n=1 Tax=Streptomyces sp. LHD-70 TaxID=3072140 RepID=UPI00280FC455|nr:hypothetical protein [Streptomyces sp. LHD-70]MDQ8702775.1 hypothetical protein [Streptomyces sp. LHD-70]
MDLTPYVDHLRQELAVAAEAGGEESRALAERLSAPLESATRLTLLEALSAAMAEVTQDLAPGSVDVRLRGRDPEFVVTAPAGPEAYEERAEPPAPPVAPPAPVDGDDGGTSRINFRLPAHLKARVEEAAGREGLSVNAWLVRAVATAMDTNTAAHSPARGRGRGHQGFTGWVR